MNEHQPYIKHRAAKRLMKFARACGFSLSVVDRLDDPSVYAEARFDTNTIVVTIKDARGKVRSLADFIFLLAHEVRHVEHNHTGMYKPYYDDTPIERFAAGDRRMRKRPISQVCSLLVGLRAERDCDRYALNYVREHLGEDSKVSSYLKRKYRAHDVSAYDDFQAAVSDNMRGATERYEKWLDKWGKAKADIHVWRSEKKRKRARATSAIDYTRRGIVVRLNRLLKEVPAIQAMCGDASFVKDQVATEAAKIQAELSRI